MWYSGQASAADDDADALRTWALSAGVDAHHADDVAAAVACFCRARHGTISLSRDYLLFLLMRAAPRTAACSDGAIKPFDHELCDPLFFRALTHASDPASLYEAHRRRLVWCGASDAASSGRAVFVNLGRIKSSSRDELELLWMSVFRRVADWSCAWRQGDTSIRSIVISGRTGVRGEWRSLKALLAHVLAVHERSGRLPQGELLWAH